METCGKIVHTPNTNLSSGHSDSGTPSSVFTDVRLSGAINRWCGPHASNSAFGDVSGPKVFL